MHSPTTAFTGEGKGGNGEVGGGEKYKEEEEEV